MSSVNPEETGPRLSDFVTPQPGRTYLTELEQYTARAMRCRGLDVGSYVHEIAETFGVVPDPEQTYAFQQSVAIEDVTGARNVFACAYDAKLYSGLSSAVSTPAQTLRGLMEHQRVIRAFGDGELQLWMESMISTRALNGVTDVLGFTRGVDAFDMVSQQEGRRVPLGDWIGAIANRSILQSGLDEKDQKPLEVFYRKVHIPNRRWYWRHHDLEPSGHVYEWFATDASPVMFGKITGRAAHLVSTYGKEVGDKRYSAIRDFGEASDRLDILVDGPYEAVSAMDGLKDQSSLESAAHAIHELVKREDVFRRPGGKVLLLQAFDIMPSNIHEDAVGPFAQMAYAEYACAVAGLFQIVDAVRPRADEDPAVRAARLGAWQAVIDTCAPFALRNRLD